MAELKNGPLGSISGKLGNMVASNWREISYLRGLSKRTRKEPTEGQKLVHAKFYLLQGFLSQIKNVIDIGFGNKNTGRATAMNLAFKANNLAFTGDLETLELNLPAIVISVGSLVKVTDPLLRAASPGKVSLEWTKLGVAGEADSDRLHLVLYNAAKNLHIAYTDVAMRQDLEVEVDVPASFAGDQLHGYLFLTTEKGEKTAGSVYLAPVTVL